MNVKTKKMNKNLKYLMFLLIVMVIFFLVYIVEINILSDIENDKINIQMEISNNEYNIITAENRLNKINQDIKENDSELQDLKISNIYNLHNPTYKEADNFMKNDDSNKISDVINNAKSQGLRCAYVYVSFTNGYYLGLIGFETMDEGMVYFEYVSDFQVIPEVGKEYANCIVGVFNQEDVGIIEEILMIW